VAQLFSFGKTTRMSKPNDQELFAALQEMRSLYPDMRFGQLICNLATWARGTHPGSVWDLEDQELVQTAREHIRKKGRNG